MKKYYGKLHYTTLKIDRQSNRKDLYDITHNNFKAIRLTYKSSLKGAMKV